MKTIIVVFVFASLLIGAGAILISDILGFAVDSRYASDATRLTFPGQSIPARLAMVSALIMVSATLIAIAIKSNQNKSD
ncbi:MAG: hypothetical protein AAFN91_13225 [Pseudomonadota bacterium]